VHSTPGTHCKLYSPPPPPPRTPDHDDDGGDDDDDDAEADLRRHQRGRTCTAPTVQPVVVGGEVPLSQTSVKVVVLPHWRNTLLWVKVLH